MYDTPRNKLLTSVAIIGAVTTNLSIAHAADEQLALEEITVTAQKRAQNIQDVPVSITAFSDRMLKEIGATSLNDISIRTPGLNFNDVADLKINSITMRGIKAGGGSAGADPTVGVYLDDVYLGGGVGAHIDYFDVAGVEVLRGPQGTLFGRNTIAGVLHLTSRKPTDELEGEVSANYGNYDALRLNGTISGPLIDDKLSGRVTAYYDTKDGDINNLTLGTKGNGSESFGVNAKLRFTPTEDSEFLLSFGYREYEGQPRQVETLMYNPDALFTFLLGAFDIPLNDDPYDRNVYSDIQSEETLEAWNVALRSTVDFSNMSLVSITSFRKHDYYNNGDTDMSPLAWLYDGDPEKVKRFSQELQLVSDNEGPFNWILGAYYFNQHTENKSFVNLGDDLADVLELPYGLFSGSDAIMDVDSYAAFAHVNYDITESLRISVGGRYTHEKKSIDYTLVDVIELLGSPVENLLGSDTWNAFTPSISVQYNWSDDIMSYVTVSRGFKSGGFNDALGSGDAISFDPEFLWNYEFGLKTSLWEDRIILNLSYYHMEWSNIQLDQDNPDTPAFDPTTFNGGAATSEGIEAEITVLASQYLEFGGNLIVQDAEYTNGTDLSGNPLGNFGLPDFTYSVYGKFNVDLSDDLNLSLRAEYLYEDASSSDLNNVFLQEGYGLLNGRIALSNSDETWEVALWGRNLTNKNYVERFIDLGGVSIVGQQFIELNRPRTYGVEARFTF